MRPCSAALISFLNNPVNTECMQADLFTFALVGGPTLRYSGWTTGLTVLSAGFPAGSINAGANRTFILGPRFGRSKVTTKVGVDPAELDIEILAGNEDLVGTFTFAKAIQTGQFDGATVELDRLFAPPPAAGSSNLDLSLGTMIWFYGQVAEADVGRSKIILKVKSLVNLLATQQMPRRLYQSSCGHIFGDTMCGYDRTLGKNALGVSTGIGAATITATAGSDTKHIVAGFSPSPSYIYDQGTITGLTGANTGVSRTISGVVSGNVYPVRAFLMAVANGDTFTVKPGCDHTTATCNGTYSNLLRYGGFAYIPPPEAAV